MYVKEIHYNLAIHLYWAANLAEKSLQTLVTYTPSSDFYGTKNPEKTTSFSSPQQVDFIPTRTCHGNRKNRNGCYWLNQNAVTKRYGTPVLHTWKRCSLATAINSENNKHWSWTSKWNLEKISPREYSKKTKIKESLVCSRPVKNCQDAFLPLLKNNTTKCYKILAAAKSMLNPRSCEVPQFPLKLIKVQPEKPISGSCRPVTEGCCGTFLRTLLRSGFLWDLQAFADSPRSKSPNRTPFPRPDAVWWTHPAWSRIEPWLIHHIPLWMNLPNEITSFHCMKSLVCKFSSQSRKALNILEQHYLTASLLAMVSP